MSTKDFDGWNQRKVEINKATPNFYHEREVRWCSLGVNIGFEQDGTGEMYKRPVLIIKGFSRYACLVVPLTTSQKRNQYHFEIGKINFKRNFVVLSQLRLIDTKRLGGRLTVLGKDVFYEIRKTIRNLI